MVAAAGVLSGAVGAAFMTRLVENQLFAGNRYTDSTLNAAGRAWLCSKTICSAMPQNSLASELKSVVGRNIVDS